MKLSSYRKINFFEIVLLIVGIGVGAVGLWVIGSQYRADPTLSWELFQTVILWLSLIILLILAATMEDVKEELGIIIREQVRETKLLKDISQRQLDEIRLLRAELTKKK